ncbi:PH domain-containing protein [Mycetocola miduiensis]|uniref:Putative membrane protein n=1 Tax=Mycetocola miduiensis TaxID=995034 RepID=A0A1I5B9H6_9MICO|nr:PH domain-containing protein [Mycetocola miduiensis]SFN71375.1 putative membrane protein [Mycetocola miduiensis]
MIGHADASFPPGNDVPPQHPGPEGRPEVGQHAGPRDRRSLTDGEWHRLHAATPLLRGGIAFLAITGFVIANLRERLVDLFLPRPSDYDPDDYDPLTYVWEHGYIGLALLAVFVILVVVMAAFYLSWRMHTFRVTDEAVEVRSGILFRTHRNAKLDRIQGVGITRPFLPRLFGAAKMEVSVAGADASVKLEYLYSRDADDLRRDVLTLASGVRLASEGLAPAPTVGPDGIENEAALSHLVNERVNEFLAPELDPGTAPPESVVRIPLGRLIGSTLLSLGTVFVVILVAAMIVSLVNGQIWALFWFVPSVIGIASYFWSTITKSLRYSIAGTPSGVRIGFGLFSTSNDTLPPGRVHAIEVSQSILWRPFGWWQVKINKAGLSAEAAAGGKGNTTVLPVGTLVDVSRVVELMLGLAPSAALHDELDLAIREPSRSGFVLAPRRARWLDPFAWRRTGYTLHDGLLFFRKGVVWRKLDLLPLARMVSFAVSQGPIERMLRVASARAHTVIGPITATLPVIGTTEAAALFEQVSAGIVTASRTDHSHRWAETQAGISAPILGDQQ